MFDFLKPDTRSALAILLVLGVMALMFLMAVKAPESDSFKILLGGVMTVGFASVIAWYFGSSSGSAMKDEALAKTSQAQAETIASQSTALAGSAPIVPVTTTTRTDAQAGTAETVTAPAPPQASPPQTPPRES